MERFKSEKRNIDVFSGGFVKPLVLSSQKLKRERGHRPSYWFVATDQYALGVGRICLLPRCLPLFLLSCSCVLPNKMDC